MVESAFNVFTPGWPPDTVLAFNTLSGAFTRLTREQFRRIRRLLDEAGTEPEPASADRPLWESLRAGGFLSDPATDERAIVRDRYWARRRTGGGGLSLTIAPTVACNLRCGYCFEQHPNRSMKEPDVAAILGYVSRNLGGGSSLGITWFGGEPLLAFDTIRALSPRLKDLARSRECQFQQSIITNGVLLTSERARELAALGDWARVQITLDGPPEIHDSRRHTARGGATFAQILGHLTQCADLLPIDIRINVDRTNYESLPRLVQLLDGAALAGRVSVYLGHTYSYDQTASRMGTEQLSIEEFASVEAQFKLLLFRSGFTFQQDLMTPREGPFCVADNPRGALISPGGLVFKCWNETALGHDDAIGSLAPVETTKSSPTDRTSGPEPAPAAGLQRTARQRENSDHWSGFDPFTHEECRHCKAQPLCMGGCPWEARTRPASGPGHCTPLRYNLEDTLRLHDLFSRVTSAVRSRLDTRVGSTACNA